jgi:hypothetical protein
MRIGKTGKDRCYAWTVRCVAIVAAFCFAMVTVVANLHYHGTLDSLRTQVTGQRLPTKAIHHVDPSMATIEEGNCPFCDWLAKPTNAVATLTFQIAIAFSMIAVLLISVRVATLCSRPVPRRCLRAPPLVCVA